MKMNWILGASLGCVVSLCVVQAESSGKPTKTAASLDLPPPSGKADVSYAADIKPIFDASCVRCHASGKAKAKLRLDSLPNALHGGEHGKVIQPGNSSASLLIHCVAHLGEKDKHMPPLNNKAKIGPLTKEQIGLLRAWIDQGAK